MENKHICECHNREFKTRGNLTTHLWAQRNQEHIKKYNDIPENKARRVLIRKRRYDNNKEELLKKHREYLRTPEVNEKHKIRNRQYYQTPQGKLSRKANNTNKKIRLLKSSKLTAGKVRQTYERNTSNYGTLFCELCFQPAKFNESSIEHFIPISRHEEFPNLDLNELNNLGVAHDGVSSKEKCNLRKCDMTLEEWFQKYPKYLIEGINIGHITLKK